MYHQGILCLKNPRRMEKEMETRLDYITLKFHRNKKEFTCPALHGKKRETHHSKKKKKERNKRKEKLPRKTQLWTTSIEPADCSFIQEHKLEHVMTADCSQLRYSYPLAEVHAGYCKTRHGAHHLSLSDLLPFCGH